MQMNPEIKNLVAELRFDAAEHERDGFSTTAKRLSLAAMILQAVFDPENQPSQYGTTLVERSD